MMEKAIQLLTEYVSYPSISNNPDYAEGMLGARQFVRRRLGELGFTVEECQTPLHPVVLARRGHDQPGSADWPHLLIYGHYDVQPAEPLELWTRPAFSADIRDGRIYGRGAADNKGPFIVHTMALENLLRRRPDLPLKVTFLLEGEEEIGSPSFAGFLEQKASELANADLAIISDTGGPSADQLVVTTALRGLVDLELQVYGPSSDLHSGLFGGAVLNPLQALMELVATLHHPDGSINVPGFYDGVVPAEDWEREELARLPVSDEELRDFLGVPALRPPPGFTALEAIRFQPTLEINGMGGGYQGPGPKTIIPSRAFCKITCRLVSDQDPLAVQDAVARTLEERCPKGVRLEIGRGHRGRPYMVVPPGHPNTPADMSTALKNGFSAIDAAVEKHFGKRPLYLREGGSIPIVEELRSKAGLSSILLGLYTSDDRMHAPDESFHLGIMEKAIPAFEEIFELLAEPKSDS